MAKGGSHAESVPKRQPKVSSNTAKSVIPAVKESQIISSRAQRDVLSDKGEIKNLLSGNMTKSESPINSNDLNLSQKSDKSGLKSTKDGLISIEEKLSEKPQIRIQDLGDPSPHMPKALPPDAT